jgi:hypothetical protein
MMSGEWMLKQSRTNDFADACKHNSFAEARAAATMTSMPGLADSSTLLSDEQEDEGEDTVLLAVQNNQQEHERVTEKKSCWAWEYIHILTNGPISRRRNTKGNKDAGILCGFVCTLCLKKGVPFRDSLISLHNSGISNGVLHLLLVHKMKKDAGENEPAD